MQPQPLPAGGLRRGRGRPLGAARWCAPPPQQHPCVSILRRPLDDKPPPTPPPGLGAAVQEFQNDLQQALADVDYWRSEAEALRRK